MGSGLWNRCVDELRYHLSDSIFTMWIRPLTAREEGNLLIISAPNEYFANYVKKNYFMQIETVVKRFQVNKNFEIQIGVDNVPKSLFLVDEPNEDLTESVSNNKIHQTFQYLDPNFTFEQFVNAKSNQIAYSVCREVAQKPGKTKYNPLFLYGSTGLGKTHLMQSVAHEVSKKGKEFYYFTSGKFINQLVNAIQQKKIDEFKAKIRKVDLLIIDDIHVMAGKPKSSSEFLLLFDDFISNNKQIILASDRHPNALIEFDERAKSRFSWGLSVALDPPEIDVRVQILQKKSEALGVALPKECAIFIARYIMANVRELEGALNKVVVTARLLNQPIHLELVQMALRDIIAIRAQAVSLDNIRKIVAEFYNISVRDLMGKKRTRNIARPRHIAMALARELTHKSYLEIGQSFGGKDHTTVMHACDKVRELCLLDPLFDRDYRTLKMMLQT